MPTLRKLLAVVGLAITSFAILPVIAQGKPYVMADERRWTMGDQMQQKIKPASVTRKNEWTKAVPNACYKEASKSISDTNSNPQCTLDNLKVAEVWFSDAPTPWVICRCADTGYSEADFLANIGRVPVGFRQYVRHFMGFGQKDGGKIAYSTWQKDLVFMNINMMNILHEVGHQVDPFWQKENGKHATSTFKNAINQDSCWTTWYAHISGENPADPAFGADGNLIEVWSEAFWLRQYQRAVGSWPNGLNLNCAMKQINAAASLSDAINNGGYNPDNYIEFNGETTSRTNLKAEAALKASTMGLRMAVTNVVSSVTGFSPAAENPEEPPLVDYTYSETMARLEGQGTVNPGAAAI